MTDRLSDRTRAAREEFERFDTVLERALGRVEAIEGLEFSAAPASFRSPGSPGAPGSGVVLGPNGDPVAGGGGGGGLGGGSGPISSGARRGTGRGGSGGVSSRLRVGEEEDRLIPPAFCLTADGGRTGGPLLPETTILSDGTASTVNGKVVGYWVGRCFYRGAGAAALKSSARSSGGGGGGGGMSTRERFRRAPITAVGPNGGADIGSSRPNLPGGSASAAASAAFNFPTDSLERGLGEVASQVKGLRQDLASGDGGASLAFKGLR